MLCREGEGGVWLGRLAIAAAISRRGIGDLDVEWCCCCWCWCSRRVRTFVVGGLGC